uniref:Uncharacterized protein n=1 Tax=Rhizophora mucronata TaxID=61149 RepID=A0A2P2QV13_RHIMU
MGWSGIGFWGAAAFGIG